MIRIVIVKYRTVLFGYYIFIRTRAPIILSKYGRRAAV